MFSKELAKITMLEKKPAKFRMKIIARLLSLQWVEIQLPKLLKKTEDKFA